MKRFHSEGIENKHSKAVKESIPREGAGEDEQ
jgi:hypothetical protein